MSGRGTITSRTTASPKSMIEWMKARSVVSITSSAWATSAMASSSDSVTLERATFSPAAADEQVGQPDQGVGDAPHQGEPDHGAHDGGRQQGGPLGVVHGPVLGDRLEEDEDDDHLEHGGHEHAQAAEPGRGQHPDQGGRDQLADQHQQQDRVQELLGVLDEAHQLAGPAPVVVEQGLGLHPRGAHQAGLGEGQEARQPEQDHDHRDQQPVDPPEAGGGGHPSTRSSGAPPAGAPAWW